MTPVIIVNCTPVDFKRERNTESMRSYHLLADGDTAVKPGMLVLTEKDKRMRIEYVVKVNEEDLALPLDSYKTATLITE